MAVLKVNQGDILAIPAQKNNGWGFVLSRVIYNDKATCIEVFEKFHDNFGMTPTECLAENFSAGKRLFNPVLVALDFGRHFGKIKWEILAKSPKYDPEQSGLSDIEFENASYPEVGSYTKGRKEFHEPPDVRRSLESRTIYSNTQLVCRINMYIQGIFKKNEPWNPLTLKPVFEQQNENWWSDELKACMEPMDAVALKINNAQKAMRKLHRD